MADEQRGDRSTPIEDLYSEYTVYDMHYEKIGKIDDLFVDENDSPEYVGVKMGFLGTRTTLIPVDIVRVNDRRRLVEVAADKETVKNGPTFSEDREITSEFERQVLDYYRVETRQASTSREAYGAYYPESASAEEERAAEEERVVLRPDERVGDTRSDTTGSPDREPPDYSPRREGAAERSREHATEEEEIRVQRVEEELVAGTRERGAGSVNVRKRVRADRERLSVPKKREDVSVERVPVEEESRREAASEAGGSEVGIQESDNEIRIPIIEEEIVVEKRPVVKEEIRIRKDVVQDEELVEEYVRKEEVDIEDWTERGGGSERAKTADHETADRSSKGSRDEASLEEGGKADRKVRPKVRHQERTSNRERTSKKDQQRAASADGTKGNQEEGLLVAEYDALTVEEAKKRLSGLSEGELKKIRSYEKKHKNRKTLVRSLDHEINKIH
ncbi:MAG TPA: DUF2382 domain-containing protein [Rubrobacteraceae bacterium]